MMLDLVLKSSALLVAALLFDRLTRGRTAAAVRHAVWGCALAGALLTPVLARVLPAWHVPMPAAIAQLLPPPPAPAAVTPATRDTGAPVASANRTARAPAVLPATPTWSETGATAPGAGSTVAPPAGTTDSPSAAATGSAPWPSLAALGLGVWIAGGVLLLGRLIVGVLAAWRLSATAPSLAPPLVRRAELLAHRIGVRRHVQFVQTGATAMPMACGLLHPTIVLPAEADAWPDARLEAVLLHELAHVRRRDCLTQALADATLAVHWINPLAWIAVRALRREREGACDDLVLAAGTDAEAYAEHLIEVARATRQRTLAPAPAGAVAMAHRSELEGRLMAILDVARPRRALTRLHMTTTAVFALGLAVPLAALTPWTGEHTEILDPAQNQNAPAAATPVAPPTLETPAPAVASTPVRASAPAAPAAFAPAPIASVVASAIVTAPVLGHQLALTAAPAIVDPFGSAQTPTPTPKPTPTPTPTPAPADGVVGGVPGAVRGAVTPAIAGTPRPRKPVDPKVVAALTDALKDTDADVRAQALHTLGQLRDPSTVDALAFAMGDKEPDVRQQAAFALGQLRDKRALPALSKGVSDSDAEVRQQSVFALGQLRDPGSVGALMTALKDPDEDVRQQAAFALGQIRDPKAVDALLVAVKDAHTDVRSQALFALGQIGDSRAQDAAMAALKDSDPDVRRMAAHLLARIVGRD